MQDGVHICLWSKVCARCTRGDFRVQHPHLFLLRTTLARRDFEHSFQTRAMRISLSPGEGLEEHERFIPLIKAAGGRPGPISLGRALDGDIVIRDSSVSKIQARIRDVTAASAAFEEARSSNPTVLQGTRLAPGACVTLRPWDQIAFGRVHCVIVTPEAVFDLCAPGEPSPPSR